MKQIYWAVPTENFIEHVRVLTVKTQVLLKDKILLAEKDPFRNKALRGHKFVFRIRIQDEQKDLRVIYKVQKNTLQFLCILNRKDNYKNLQKHIR